MGLTVKKVESLLSKRKPGRYTDSKGLHLFISKTGQASWVHRITFNGHRKNLGLGSAKTVKLKDARKRALDNVDRVERGLEPLSSKAYKRPASTKKVLNVPTLEEMGLRYHAEMADSVEWRESTAQTWLSRWNSHVAPTIGRMPIDQVERVDVRRMIDELAKTQFPTAQKVLVSLKKVMEYAVERDERKDDPLRRFKMPKRPKSQRVKHHDALPYWKVADAIQRFENSPSGTSSKLAFRFMVLTAKRISEVLEMQWCELNIDDDTDYPFETWTIPGHRRKTAVNDDDDFREPLSRQASDLLAQAFQHRKDDVWVFPSPQSKKPRPLARQTFAGLFKNYGIHCTPHGFRTSFRQWAGRHVNAGRDVIEMCLSHREDDAYDRDDYVEQRAAIMQEYADYLDAELASLTD